MTDGSTQTIEIQGTPEVLATDVADRLKKIEDKLESAAVKKDKKDFWDKLQASGATGLFSSLVLAFIGFLLTGAISNSVQQRQIELASVEKMQSLIADLANPMIKEDDADIKATTLAAFGKPAIPAFVSLLGKDNPTALRVADKGLHMTGSAHPSSVCVYLTSILRNRSRLYPWLTFKHTLDLVGDLNCQSSQSAVEDFKAQTTTLEKLNAFTATDAQPGEFDDLRARSESILQRLKNGPRVSPWRGLKRLFRIGVDEDVEDAG